MKFVEKFEQRVLEKKWWTNQDKVLIAVSGGVDSMVLLELMDQLEESVRPNLVVAHVNHQLRSVSIEEEEFVRSWCAERRISFVSTRWDNGPFIQKNMELEARKFRYAFFKKVMIESNISILLTGHHQNDQVETILMRLIGGNRLKYLIGIEEKREFETGHVIRPLLTVDKKSLYNYAALKKIPFFEDETNQESHYLRNRLRNQLIPLLRAENPKFEEQLLETQRELRLGLELIEESIASDYEAIIVFNHEKSSINQSLFIKLSEAKQHFILTRWVSELQQKFQLIVNKKQQEAVAQLLLSHNPNQRIDLKDNWVVYRSYSKVILKRHIDSPKESIRFELFLNQGVDVSETEWFGLFEENNIQIPKKFKDWSQKELKIMPDLACPLVIRKRLPGDKLILNEKGQTKKIRRYFIDEKIPHEEREKSWVVSDNEGQIKWLVPFRESYLSIRDETDKIHYKLVYLNKKDR